jgi:hypothetical protein
MNAKMTEMDDLIHRVHTALAAPPQLRSHENATRAVAETSNPPPTAAPVPPRRSLLVVSSDHGMTSLGNHGGSSFSEVETLLLLLPASAIASACSDGTDSCARSVAQHPAVRQVDVAPTLALLMGVPVGARMHTHAPARARTSLHARTRARTHARTRARTRAHPH